MCDHFAARRTQIHTISFKLTSPEGTCSAPLQPQEHGEHVEHDEHIEHGSTRFLNNALINLDL